MAATTGQREPDGLSEHNRRVVTDRRLVTPSRLQHPEMAVIVYLVMMFIVFGFLLACLIVFVAQLASAQAVPVMQILGGGA